MSEPIPGDLVPVAQPTTKVHLADGTFIKAHRIPVGGTVLPQHSHAYSHTSYIATGAVKVWKDGAFQGVVTAPDGILIEAHAKHLFQTLADDTTILCIHNVSAAVEPEIEDEHRLAAPAPAGPRERLSMDGFTFQDEQIDLWYAEATDLFREHMAATGQDLDDWSRKNLAVGRQLDAAGALQILTARSSNGTMQGYLISVIGPSLDSPDAVVAQQTSIFASPACPGLGMRLQQESIAMLRARGVTEIHARAGTRGDGPRLGTMFRRLGFEEAGQLYRLEM